MNHDEAWSLLPWLVNETLSGTEQAAVDTHVRGCLLCRRELGMQRQISRGVNASPTIRISAQRGFASLMEKVDAGLDNAVDTNGAILMVRRTIDCTVRFWNEALSTNQRWVTATTAAAGCLIAVLLAVTTVDDSSDAARYTTLTTTTAGQGNLVEVVFADGATKGDIDAVLARFKARILEGPSQNGVYTIAISGDTGGEFDEVPAARQLDPVIRGLSDDPRVRFAGFAFGSTQPDPP